MVDVLMKVIDPHQGLLTNANIQKQLDKTKEEKDEGSGHLTWVIDVFRRLINNKTDRDAKQRQYLTGY